VPNRLRGPFGKSPWISNGQVTQIANAFFHDCDGDTVDGSEIPNNHLGCTLKTFLNNGINYQPQLVSRMFFPSTVPHHFLWPPFLPYLETQGSSINSMMKTAEETCQRDTSGTCCLETQMKSDGLEMHIDEKLSDSLWSHCFKGKIYVGIIMQIY